MREPSHLRVVRDSAPPPPLALPDARPWWDSYVFGAVLALGSIGLAVAIAVMAGWVSW